jgi:catechol 2,3-dioxygenase-like lactoylglutathione lyase family enzyme
MNTPLVKPELLSHGTIECSDLAATRRFLTEFLGIDVVRPLPEAQYLWKGGPWSVVCVCVPDSEAKEQGPQNRFKPSVPHRRRDAAHACARAAVPRHTEYRAGGGEAGARSSCRISTALVEITNVTQSYYDAI